MTREVVITGLGCVSPLGPDVASTWEAAVVGTNAVGPIQRFDAEGFPARIAAEVPWELDLSHLPPKEVRRLDRVVALALVAARQALSDAGVEAEAGGRARFGVAIGSGIGGIGTLLEHHRRLLEKGPRRVSPFLVPTAITNAAAGSVAIHHDLRGPNLCHATACASGAHALGEAMRLIRCGEADLMLAGGSEAAIEPLVVAGFAAMRALSTRNDEPHRASRPFDEDRDGFVLGEGAALLVLEEAAHARARGARVHARMAGYGASGDASHLASPADDGRGARCAIEGCLKDAGLRPEDVDYVNAHATSTPAGDRIESEAIRAIFGPHAERVPVSSTKSMMGHLLGAAGAMEALLCARVLETGLVPPTLNLDRPDPACVLRHVAHKARRHEARAVLSNSFGFGGTNACLLLTREENE